MSEPVQRTAHTPTTTKITATTAASALDPADTGRRHHRPGARLPAAVMVVEQRGGGRHRNDRKPRTIVEAIARAKDGRYYR